MSREPHGGSRWPLDSDGQGYREEPTLGVERVLKNRDSLL